MLELTDSTAFVDFCRGEVLKALPMGGDDWDTVQRYNFAAHLASSGDHAAKQAMYENFEPGLSLGEAIGTEFVLLDGVTGFLFAAEKTGALLISCGEEVDEGFLWSVAMQALGEDRARRALSAAAATDARIEAYLRHVELRESRPAEPLRSIRNIGAVSWEELLPTISRRTSFWLARWGEEATGKNLQLAAHALLAAEEAGHQKQYLRIFSCRAFPLDPGAIVRLAESDDEHLSIAAAQAAANVKQRAIRDLAFRLAGARLPGRIHSISILSRNFEPGDHDVALRWFLQEEDRGARHTLEMALQRFWVDHREDPTELPMLLALYEKGPCSMCREFVVARLIELGSLPDEIREECAYDANDDVRRLVRGERAAADEN